MTILYDKWIEEEIPVRNIDLDPKNPRIPIKGLSQPELLKDLIDNEDVDEVIESISTKGYFPTEILVVIEEEDQLYVVEGNRRLAALKLLLDPDKAPGHNRQRYKKISEKLPSNFKKTIKNVRAVTAPSRRDANVLIAARHGSDPVKRWGPVQKARFYRNLIQEGATYEEICKEYNLTKSELAKWIRIAEIYDAAMKVSSAAIQEKLEDRKKFNVTSLTRMYDFKVLKDFLGIDFSDKGELIATLNIEHFENTIKRIVSGEVDSRTVQNAEDAERYVEFCKGKITKEKWLSKGKGPTQPPKPPPKPPKPKPKPSKGIIPNNVECTIKDPKLQKIYGELKDMPVKNYKNASIILFRSFLQMAMVNLVKKAGDINKVEARRNGQPSLTELKTFLIKRDNKLINDQDIKDELNHADLDIKEMHSFTHSSVLMATVEKCRDKWDHLDGLMRFLLSEDRVEQAIKDYKAGKSGKQIL